jgi:hypothetical protein
VTELNWAVSIIVFVQFIFILFKELKINAIMLVFASELFRNCPGKVNLLQNLCLSTLHPVPSQADKQGSFQCVDHVERPSDMRRFESSAKPRPCTATVMTTTAVSLVTTNSSKEENIA